ncbi:hypothetical protein EON83_26235 [bacterium]|nr:MAG: hypothetical protein EON83_26235 [bacterium]
MKRFAPRELLLVTAPLAIIALGIWGAQLREQHWPTKAHIVACRVRPATPMELSQGKQIGVTYEAKVPKALLKGYFPEMEYSLVGDHTPKPLHNKISYTENRNNYARLEKYYAYRWEELSSTTSPVAEVKLISQNKGFPALKQRVELSNKDLVRPNVIEAIRENFHVTNAYIKRAPTVTPLYYVTFDIENIKDEAQGTLMSSKCLKAWIQRGSRTEIVESPATTSWISNDPTKQNVEIDLEIPTVDGKLTAGTKIRCLLSIAAGWPQEIQVQWPQHLNPDNSPTELKFTTKLAPLP